MIPIKVLLVENGTAGGGHARSNLSVLLSVHHAWPEAVLLVACSEKHHGALKERMSYCSESVPPYEFLPLVFRDIGPDALSSKTRRVIKCWYEDLSKTRQILKLARKHNADLVVDLWTSGIRVLATKVLKNFYGLKRIAFLHFEHNWGVGQSRQRLKRWLLPHTLHALKIGGNCGHAYGLLHGRMREDIAAMAKIQPRDNFFDFSYGICWPEVEPAFRSVVGRRVRFGYISPSFKGLADFARVVDRVHDELTEDEWNTIEFEVIGRISRDRYAEGEVKGLENLNVVMGGTRLGEEQFARAIAQLDYAVHVYDKNHYRIRYSSSLQDTVAFCRPAIMTATGYAESLRDLEPEYGYLVNSTDEAADIIVAIVRTLMDCKYLKEVECATRLRDCFSIARSANQIGFAYALALRSLQATQSDSGDGVR